MKSQALFSSNDKSKELKCRLLQFLWRFKGYYNKPQQDKQRLTACENSTFALSDQTFLLQRLSRVCLHLIIGIFFTSRLR